MDISEKMLRQIILLATINTLAVINSALEVINERKELTSDGKLFILEKSLKKWTEDNMKEVDKL